MLKETKDWHDFQNKISTRLEKERKELMDELQGGNNGSKMQRKMR